MAAPAPSVDLPHANWQWRAGTIEPADASAAVVFDIDGVLSDAAGRQHFLEGGRRDWHRFFEACGDDPVIEELARVLHLLDADLQIVLLTGRPFSVRPQTLAWLERYELRWDLLVMRNRGDYTQVTTFKRSAVADLRAHGFDLRLAFEDDPSNSAMFHEEGVPCVYIHSGYYE
jgi:phosphoglycolate phosphatase-like HAD superfamily hydrolase